MAQPNEQDKFSIDEIMDRLKNPPDEEPVTEGQLITLEDGSQAIRVRKRKRRTNQPHKTNFKKKWLSKVLQISALVIFLVVALSIVGSAIIFANSAPYRKKIVQIIGSSSGSEVKLEQFRVNPVQAVAGQLKLAWPEGNVLREFSARGIAADIAATSFWGDSLTGDEMNSQQGTLTLGVPQAGSPTHFVAMAEPPLPVRFNRYAVQQLQVRFGDAGWIRNVEASFQPQDLSKRTILLLNGGAIDFSSWPKNRLGRAHIEFRNKEIEIVGMRLLHEIDKRGTMDLQGLIAPYEPDRAAVLSVRMDSFPLTGVAGSESERLISCRIDTVPSPTSNQLSFHCRANPNAKLSINFQNSSFWPLELQGFRFLADLAKALEDQWFERPIFEQDAMGALIKTSEGVEFDQLSFENKGRMAVRGNMRIGNDRRLSGTLRIGISEAMVKAAPNRRLDQIAGPAEQGYRWFSVTLGGSTNSPTDDFSQLLQSAKSPETPAKTQPVPSFEELIAPE